MADNPRKRAAHYHRPDPSAHGAGGGVPARRSAAPAPGRLGVGAGVRTHASSSKAASVTRRVNARMHGRGAGGTRAHGPRRGPAVFLAALLALLLLAGGVFACRHFMRDSGGQSQVAPGQIVTVAIPEGSGSTEVAKILSDSGVISDVKDFLAEVKSQGAEASIKPGAYDLMTGGNLRELVRQLVSGPNSTSGKLAVAEGLTVSKTAALVEASLHISAEEFLAQAKASNYAADYPFLADAQNDSLEGFLFPKTYAFTSGDLTADVVIRAMLDQYKAEVASLDTSSYLATLKEKYGVSMSGYDILKMASIIEREALTNEDRYNISSVMYNRLRDDMFLQSDAAMGYVTGGEVNANDLDTDSPYNTYLYKGLTPTPICAPSLDSIQAALRPADTGYYYFWITSRDHKFSETYEQHQQAIADAQGGN